VTNNTEFEVLLEVSDNSRLFSIRHLLTAQCNTWVLWLCAWHWAP